MTDENPTWSLDQTQRIAQAIRDLRGDRSAQWVSDATAELGHRVTRAIIADLESGRRKYVAVHELFILAAVLGVTPATMLTWRELPDGKVDVLPVRAISAMDACDWFGGRPLNRFETATMGLPSDHPQSAELMRASLERSKLGDFLMRAQIAGMSNLLPDPELVNTIKVRLSGAIERIKALGGVIAEPKESKRTMRRSGSGVTYREEVDE